MTYESIWAAYAAGRLSDLTMHQLLTMDEVFRAWCLKRVKALRLARDKAARQG